MLGDRKLLAWTHYTVEVKLGARMSPEGHKSWSKPVQAVVRTPPALPSRWVSHCLSLKVPKHEIFLTELIILSYPIWIGDLGSTAKNGFV